MRIARARVGDEVFYAVLEDNRLKRLAGLPYINPVLTGQEYNLTDAKLLAPVEPGKIVAVGLNYNDHIREMGDEVHDDPVLFLKPPSAVIGPGEPIQRPTMSKRVDYEAELAVIIGDRLSHATPERALDAVLAIPAPMTLPPGIFSP